MGTTNLKDKLTMICAWVTGFFGGVIGILVAADVPIPKWVYIGVGILLLAANVTTQVMTGKNPDGTTKTEVQVAEINAKAVATKPVEEKKP